MRHTVRLIAFASVVGQLACAPEPPSEPIVIDGSSTLRPLTEAVTADFMKSHPTMPVKLSFAGTVEGFQHFCRGELDIVDASRPVTEAEQSACEAGGVSFIELPVAMDALTVIINTGNTWASSMTVSELRTLWEPAADKTVTKWNQVRADWPDRPITLYGPGAESGTFDYFTEAVMGTVDASRNDYTASGDDKVIVDGVGGNIDALGYVGYSYFDHNRKTLKAVAIDDGDDRGGKGPIEPSPQAVGRGTYRPFSRPLFIYVNKARLARTEVKTFADSYLRRAGDLAASAGSVSLMSTSYNLATQRLAKGVTGTMFKTADSAHLDVDLLLTQ